MTAGQVALFLWVSSFVVPVRYLYRRLRRVRVEVSLNDLRTRGVDVSLPSDWLGATCCAGFELGDSAVSRTGTLPPVGSPRLRRTRFRRWSTFVCVATFRPRATPLVAGGQKLLPLPVYSLSGCRWKMVGATIQYDRIHDAALRVNSSGGSAARGPVRFRGWWRGSTAWCTWHPGSGIGTAK